VSYILDALKKAAEQRDAHVPAMRRLFSPAPEIADSPRWRLAAVAGGAAVAGAIVAVWVLWPTPPGVIHPETPSSIVAARAEPATPTVAARTEPAAPAVPAPAPPSPVRTAAKPPAPVKPSVEKPATPLPPPAPSRPAPVESVAPRPEPTESVAPPSKPAAPPASAAVRPAPVPVVTPAPAAASRDAGGPLRVEVIVYSDERERRLAFINGRKYVEGDVLQDGTRIQEIQPNAVVIIDDGRRVVLRP